MSFSSDWLGIEDDEHKESPPKEKDYMTLLRQQQQQQTLAYRQEMMKRQQQLQLLQQQQLLQRQIVPTQVASLPQSQSYHQSKIQQMQLLQQQLMQQKVMNQASISRSTPQIGNRAPVMVPGTSLASNTVMSPVISSANVGLNRPITGGVDNWTKGYLNFMKNIGKEVTLLPNINGQMLNLKAFLHYVVDLGGFDKVMTENKWPIVTSRLGLSSDASEKVAYFYKNLLLDFERRVFPGLSLLAQSEMRKKMINVPVKNAAGDQTEVNKTVPLHAVYQTSDERFIDSPLQSYGSPASESFTESQVLPLGSQSEKESDPTIYMPKVRKISSYGGYDNSILDLANTHQKRSTYSIGVIDLYRVKMSLKSQLDSDCQYAIDSILYTSVQQRTLFSLEKYSDLVDSLFDLLLLCLREAFGECETKKSDFQSKYKMTYLKLYEMEMESLEYFQKGTESTFQTPKLMLSERILAMATALRNFSFEPVNALFLSKHRSFWPAMHSILCLCLQNDANIFSPLTLQEAGILDHRKNLVIIFSNMGSHLNIPSDSSQLVFNLLEDFLSNLDSIYSYSALEALAKLSLVEENHKFFISASNLRALITTGAEFLPREGFRLNSSQDVVAEWELASLFIYNICAMDDDRGRCIIMESANVVKYIMRIARNGIKTGNDGDGDYVRIITLRMLKCIRELSSSDDSKISLCRFESYIISMMMDTKVMPSSSAEFKNQAGMILSDVLKCLEEN